jgi:hypothetical protein
MPKLNFSKKKKAEADSDFHVLPQLFLLLADEQ